MLEGSAVVAALKVAGVTDVVWIPDSDLGRWEAALSAAPELRLLRVCREGEAVALAAGLILGGRRPIVLMQCTGLFEAGDSLRNCVHDLKLPLFLVVGVRNWLAHQKGQTTDNCPLFAEPILRAWQIPFVFLDPTRGGADDLAAAYCAARDAKRAGAVLLAE
jgi:sulfopyruvate decarboxylase TPP-binding subunit